MTKTKKTPLWRSIAQTLHTEIANDVYSPGDKLPTEVELAKRFGVNRHTVRHAVATLVEDGLLRTRRGAGVFVIRQPITHPIPIRAWLQQDIPSIGHVLDKRILQIEERAASEHEAEALRIRKRTGLCVCHGIAFANDAPVALFASQVPIARVPGIVRALQEKQTVKQALARCGVSDVRRTLTRLSAKAADATQALKLHVQEGTPLVYAASVNVDVQDRPVEIDRTWFVGDRVTLTLDQEDYDPG